MHSCFVICSRSSWGIVVRFGASVGLAGGLGFEDTLAEGDNAYRDDFDTPFGTGEKIILAG